MDRTHWLRKTSPAFRLMIATSWLAPDSWQRNQEEAIREAVGAGPDWTEYLRLVDRHRTPALSWAALGRVPELEIPEPERLELQRRSDACRMQAVKHCLRLAGLLKAFNRAGIPVMTLKGPILSLDLYGDVGLRESRDLDLAVVPDDLNRAQACLNDLGWQLDSSYFPMTPRQWEKLRRMEPHLSFVLSQGDSILELHWRNVWDTPGLNSARWARSIPSIWQGCSHQALNPIDQVLFLCCHGAEHAWIRAKWLGDLARIHAAGLVNWEDALDQARSTDRERPLLACLRLLHIVHGLPLPRLPGNPWENLSSFLIDSPLYALKISKDAPACEEPDLLPGHFRLLCYEKLVLPRRTWRESLSELAYSRIDFKVFPLPDSLFWAYVPLRPFLWVWRKLLQIWPR
jgi:hypothetical protein